MASRDMFVYNSQLDAFTLYHLVQEEPDSSTAVGPALPALGHALAGSFATAATKALLYPLDLVVTRMQVQKKLREQGETKSAARDAHAEYDSLIDAARKIYENEGGAAAFYVGCAPDVGKGLVDSFVFFLAYTFLRQRQLKRDGTRNLNVFKELAVGVVAGSFAKLITTPLQNIVTRQQTAALVAARHPDSESESRDQEQLTLLKIAKQIHEERGLLGFWAGYGASLILTINPAITFAVDNILRRMLPKSRRDNPPPQLTFLMAACSKAIATSITYPVQLAKSRAQAVSSGQGNSEKETEGNDHKSASNAKARSLNLLRLALRPFAAQYAILVALRQVAREEGISGLYAGLEGDILKGFLSHGLTMMVKDRVHGGVIATYYALLHLTKRFDSTLDAAREQAASVTTEVRERAQHVGATIVDGGKQIARDSEKAVMGDSGIAERVSNVATTLAEGAKQVVPAAGEAISNADIKQRAENIGTTGVEAAKEAVRRGRKIVGGDES